MMKFLLGVLCGLILAGMTVFVLFFAALRLGDRRPAIADGSTLVWRAEGEVPERPAMEFPIPGIGNQASLTVRDTWSMLRHAATDSRIRAVVFEPRGLSVGWGKMQELREGLLAVRKSGKPVYAYLRGPGAKEYYIASAAERIYTAPEDMLDLKGLRVEGMFFRNTLDKLGVQMEVEHAGKYKDAYDMFTRTSMSPETKQVLSSVLDGLYGNLCSTIAEGRKKSPEEVKALLDQGPFLARQAKAAGLIDDVQYEDQVFNDVMGRLKQSELKKISHGDYVRGLNPENDGTRIALVVGDGVITRGSSDFVANEGIASGAFVKLLQRARTDTTIKGAIVRIDSPGGDAIASDDILHEMRELSKAKPTVISMSDLAASGGYFIAVTGDPILAYPNTLTGSIGVISAKPNLHGLYDKLGITKELLIRGQNAGLDSDYKPLTDSERAKLRQMIDATYEGFITRVATGRHRKPEEIEPLAQGRVWLGSQAKQNGLVDQLGGLDSAVELIRQKAKIAAGQKIALVPYPQKRSLLEVIMSRAEDSASAEAAVAKTVRKLPGGAWIQSWLQGGILEVMPYSVEIR